MIAERLRLVVKPRVSFTPEAQTEIANYLAAYGQLSEHGLIMLALSALFESIDHGHAVLRLTTRQYAVMLLLNRRLRAEAIPTI